MYSVEQVETPEGQTIQMVTADDRFQRVIDAIGSWKRCVDEWSVVFLFYGSTTMSLIDGFK